MTIAVLYICTGKYDIFWKDFYLSSETYFVPNAEKHYFVFTDANELFGEKENVRVKKIFQERMGWPFDTLNRFHLFSSIEIELTKFDYIFFFNANAKFLRTVDAPEILPTEREQLVVTLHPGYYNKNRKNFTYESKQKNSTAYIPKSKGEHYFAGGINGGISSHYLKLINTLKENIDRDLEKNIIAVWHDESHLNHYLLDRKPKILSPAFIYPEGWELPFEPIILIRDKAKLGGHHFLRDTVVKKSFPKKIAGFIKKIVGR